MNLYVGIDIGAVSATSAVVAADGGLDGLIGGGLFSLLDGTAAAGRAVCIGEYRRTYGRPIAAATEILEEIIAAVGAERIAGVCLTGSGAEVAAAKLEAAVVNEFKAIALGMTAVGVEVKTVFEMGGETSKYLRLANCDGEGYSIVDYSTNGDCAAGTGSFIDQQAGRLKYRIEDVGQICLEAERAAQVAGRCSVFAKSDMIHAQQKGYTPPEVLRGLCDAVARNFRSAVVRSHPVEPPVAFIGGVTANSAVVRAMREAFEFDDSQMFVPPAHAHIPAIGAAVAAAKTGGDGVLSRMGELRAASDTAGGEFPTAEPLNMDNVVLLRDSVRQYESSRDDKRIDAYMGVDIGSVSTNVVAIDRQGHVVAEIYTRTNGRPIEVVSEALKDIERQWGDRLNIRGVGTTGSGRELIGQLIGADTINDEITAHKTGAMFVGRTMLDGRVPDTIFEIGGQDSKFISLQDGVVVDFTMNEACAAGTGSFLEERAEELGIAIKGEFAELALSSKAPIRLGERCTVFMERDVNSYMQRGADKADLVAGLAYSVVQNYINRVVRGRKIGKCIFFQGGTAYNDSVAAAFAAVCGEKIIVPPHNGVIGAIGAALLARDKMEAGGGGNIAQANTQPSEDHADRTLGTYISDVERSVDSYRESNFRGYDLSAVDYSLREFTCKACSNTCQIQEFTVQDEKTYWGDKCSDRYRKRAKSGAKAEIDDLFAVRQELLLDDSDLPDVPAGAPTVGIPMAMFALESLPMWRTLLAECGLATTLSDPTNKRIVQAGLEAVVSEPCFPIIAAHGHVADLLDTGVDYVLLPNIVATQTKWTHTNSYLCPWHQTLPFMIRQAPAIQNRAGRLLMPTVDFRRSRKVVIKALHACLAPLGVSRSMVTNAMKLAMRAQERFEVDFRKAGRDAMNKLSQSGQPGIVLVGRPYNVHDAGMNLSVARKLRDYYGVNCIPYDCLDLDDVDIRDVNPTMYWNLGRRILAAAKVVADHDNLHIIYITNFKCGPDSFIKHFVRSASGKPFLTLQFDGHSNDAGVMTRCEAYLDSKGILRQWRSEQIAAPVV